jgi:hypothetical protein
MAMDTGDDLDGFEHSAVGRWVDCYWNFEAGQGAPHPEDRALIERLAPCNSALCVGMEGDYFVLEVRNTRLRVRPAAIRIRPRAPRFRHGDLVRTIPGSGVKTELVAPVREPRWHIKRQTWTYFLAAGRKRRRRWYLESELELVRRLATDG